MARSRLVVDVLLFGLGYAGLCSGWLGVQFVWRLLVALVAPLVLDRQRSQDVVSHYYSFLFIYKFQP